MPRLAALVLLALAAPVWAQASSEAMAVATPQAEDRTASSGVFDAETAPAYYVTRRGVPMRSAPWASAPLLTTLRTREGVRVLDSSTDPSAPTPADPWWLVQYGDQRGYVQASALSNVWIRIDKSDRTTYVYRGAELLYEYPSDVSVSPEDKVRRSGQEELDHYRMPEGTFFVTRLNAASSYYRAFVLSYPGPAHALRGVQEGIITQAQYQTILRADQQGLEPPMNTPLGGLIEIHGHGSGRQRAWTRGCVALRNVHMDELWGIVQVGTPVVIEP